MNPAEFLNRRESRRHLVGIDVGIGRREGVLEMAFAVDDAEKARAALPQAELAGIG